jgi:hypothetical protein
MFLTTPAGNAICPLVNPIPLDFYHSQIGHGKAQQSFVGIAFGLLVF